ncbi:MULTISPECIES: YppG family protein [Thalassobacillus]|uniref:YppG family protein n=1 Tax=Thalassobacillus TaxID=331971 RepID=UPI000A1C7F59|nr:YppG family protein [Thalassobacillus devorans]
MFSYQNRNFYPDDPFFQDPQYPYHYQPMMEENFYNQPQNWEMAPTPGNPFELYTKPMFPQQNNMYNSYGQQPFYANSGMNPKNMAGYFQDQNGQLDMDKMMKTVGQLAQTANQLSPIMKGIGGFIKGMR